MELVLVGAVPKIEMLLYVLGCNQGSLPMKYLGLPLGDKFKEKTLLNPILDEVQGRLVGWKQIYLSKEVESA